MADAWGLSWAGAWGTSWRAAVEPPATGGHFDAGGLPVGEERRYWDRRRREAERPKRLQRKPRVEPDDAPTPRNAGTPDGVDVAALAGVLRQPVVAEAFEPLPSGPIVSEAEFARIAKNIRAQAIVSGLLAAHVEQEMMRQAADEQDLEFLLLL